MKGVHELKLTVDTGASGNTLPVRVAKQMHGELWHSKVEPVPHTKLSRLQWRRDQMLRNTEDLRSV